MNITVEREKEIKSHRARELDELRSKGVAKTQKLKIMDVMASPLTTPEQAQMFLAVMRDKSRKEGWEHKPPSNLSADGVDAWYMMQKQRERELKQKRQEAEQLLRGYRGPYFSDNSSVAWSPRHSSHGRASFGGVLSELMDPEIPEKRRQSTMPRLQSNWDCDNMSQGDRSQRGNPLESNRSDFLNRRHYYDGTDYDKFDERSAYENGRALFHDSDASMTGYEQREPGATYDNARFIDARGSQERLRGAGSAERDTRSSIGNDREDGHSSTHHEYQSEAKMRDDAQRKLRFSLENNNREAAAPSSAYHDDHRSEIPETVWRDFISSEPGAKYPPEAGRYHLYASYACPGSHRALIVRALKGLEDIVSVTIVHPTWRHTNLENSDDKHRGWVFGDPNGKPFKNTTGRGGPFPSAYPGTDPDPILNAYSVRELYEYAQDTSGKYTIPLLWDKKLNTIVNNESSDISYMLNSCFDEFSNASDLDLYTEDDEDGLDKLNQVSQWLYPMMIHGVYRCGFAKTQIAYDHAIEELTIAFDMADELLQNQRYLTGDTLTDADIRLFVTLLRFDEVYAFYFRANTRLVMLTPALLNFCREIYQMEGVATTCQMEQIKAHFFGSHAEWNKYSVVPRGLGFMRLLEQPHDRDQPRQS